MSDNYLRLISTDPQFVPTEATAELVRGRLAQLVPEADEVTSETTDKIEFVDQGGNFERVSCPMCGQELHMSWLADRMANAYPGGFLQLVVTLPCCWERISLNDLNYEWPAGFARFVLEAMNPKVPDLPEGAVAELSKLLGTPLRKIWAHY